MIRLVTLDAYDPKVIDQIWQDFAPYRDRK